MRKLSGAATVIFAGTTLFVSHLFAQVPPKIDFAARPFSNMSVYVSAEGSATYLSDRLVVNLRTLRLSDASLPSNVLVESIGLTAYALDNKTQLGEAARAPIHKELQKNGELRLENVELIVPMSVLGEDFIFYLSAYMPSGAYWITQKVEMPSLARARSSR